MNNLELATKEEIENMIRKIKDDPFVLETANFVMLSRCCVDAQKNKNLIGVIGNPGLGKSTALEKHVQKFPHTYIVKVGKSMNAKQFWGTVLERIIFDQENIYSKVSNDHFKMLNGDTDSIQEEYEIQRKLLKQYEALMKYNEGSKIGLKSGWTLNDIVKRIAENLNATAIEFETNNLLILDEAGKFDKPAQLEYLHEVRDATEKTTGIVIAGPPYWRRTLLQWSERGINGIPEVVSRIHDWIELESPKGNEIREIAKVYGINDKSTINEFKNVRDFRALMHRIEKYYKEKLNEIIEEENQSMLNLNNKMYASN